MICTLVFAHLKQGYSRTRDLDSEDLLEQLPALQQLLYRLVGCRVWNFFLSMGKLLLEHSAMEVDKKIDGNFFFSQKALRLAIMLYSMLWLW